MAAKIGKTGRKDWRSEIADWGLQVQTFSGRSNWENYAYSRLNAPDSQTKSTYQVSICADLSSKDAETTDTACVSLKSSAFSGHLVAMPRVEQHCFTRELIFSAGPAERLQPERAANSRMVKMCFISLIADPKIINGCVNPG